ncbi:MAG: NAD(P)-dependent oxidoreductase [Erysipelotrichaceae bacterium]
MKNIIIFGATGDTGKYLSIYLKKQFKKTDFKIIAIGRKKTDFFDKNNIEYIRMDITKKDEFDNLPVKDIYAVIDLAGLMPARMKGYEPQNYIDVNITGNLNILEYCRYNDIDRILFMQSFGDIKDHAEKNCILTTDSPRKFSFKSDHTIYVMCKNFTVDLIRHYHEMYGLKSFVFRLPTIYLWSDIDNYYVDGVERKIGYRLLIEKAINSEEIEVWGNPNRVKDMVYVKDFCQMIYKALLVNRDNGYYNVGTGVGITLLDQIKGIIEVFSPENNKSLIKFAPNKNDAPEYIMDITPAINELGYKPEYDYISMLKDMKSIMNND